MLGHLWFSCYCLEFAIFSPSRCLGYFRVLFFPWCDMKPDMHVICVVMCLVVLTHCGRVTHIWLIEITSIGFDNGLSPCRCQAIIWTNGGILSIWPSGTNCSNMFIEIHISSFKNVHLKMSSAQCRPFCLCPNVFRYWSIAFITSRALIQYKDAICKG